MIILPRLFTKILLIVSCLLICFHFLVINTRTYSVRIDDEKISYTLNNATDEQYQICLSSIPTLEGKTLFIKNTRTQTIFNFPLKAVPFIFIGYCIIICVFIIFIKTPEKQIFYEQS